MLLNLRLLFLITVINLDKVLASLQVLKVNQFEDCDSWANEDGECGRNPRFMWGKCFSSCLDHGLNDSNSINCTTLAEKGDCDSDAQFMLLNCPSSCGRAVVWNPWSRRKLQIDPIPYIEELADEKCNIPTDLLTAADLMKTRLSLFLSGGFDSLKGLSSDAPSEYLGMLGLTEAYLYSLRLYEFIFNFFENKEYALENNRAIEVITSTISSGYSSDLLMRNLYTWFDFVDSDSNKANQLIQTVLVATADDTSSDQCKASYGPLPSIIPKLIATPLSTAYVESGKSKVPTQVKVANTIPLSNGILFPVIGLGTWQLEEQECKQAVYEAIKIGYRMIDTAEAYRNEKEVGEGIHQAIKENLISRSELFIATKLSDADANGGYEATKLLVANQLKLLQVTYIDLYMLHSPFSSATQQKESWRALEELYQQGVLKALGVSNFDQHELEQLINNPATKIKPMVVQNKLDIYHVGKQLDNRGDKIIEYAHSQNIVVVSYSTISAYPFVMKPVEDPIVKYVASHHSSEGKTVTPAQVLLRWALQHKWVVIPRSSNSNRLQENFDALKMTPLTVDEMELFDSIQYLVMSPVSVAVPVHYDYVHET